MHFAFESEIDWIWKFLTEFVHNLWLENPLAVSKVSFTLSSMSNLTLHTGVFLLWLLNTISSWSFPKVLSFSPKVFRLPQLCYSSCPPHLLFVQFACPNHIASSSVEIDMSFKAIPEYTTWIIIVCFKDFIAGIFPEISSHYYLIAHFHM